MKPMSKKLLKQLRKNYPFGLGNETTEYSIQLMRKYKQSPSTVLEALNSLKKVLKTLPRK